MAGVGSVLSGIGSVFSGLSSIGSLFSSDDSAIEAYERQRDLMNFNNKFQSSENEKSRAFTRQMYDRQWSDLTSYNDYKNVVKRAQEAGVSPSALFGSGAPSMLGGISPGSVGHTASPSPDYGVSLNPINRHAEAFHSVTSGLQSLAQMAKAGVETGKVGALMDSQIKSLLSRAGLEQVQADSQAYEFELRKIFGPGLYKSDIGQKLAHAHSLNMQAYLASEQGKTEESKRLVLQSEKELNEAKKSMTDEQRNLYELQAEWYPKYAQADINDRNSSAEEHRAGAEEHRAGAAVKRSEAALNIQEKLFRDASNPSKLSEMLSKFDVGIINAAADKEDAFQRLERALKVSDAYKTHKGKVRVDAALENWRRMLGLNISSSVSNP